MNSNYKEKYLKYKTKFLDLKTKKQLGGAPPIPDNFDIRCYHQILEILGYSENLGEHTFGNFGKYQYKIVDSSGNSYVFEDISTIPSDILKDNHILSEHECKNADSEVDLIKFMVFRLVDKLSCASQRAEFSIKNCEDLKKLIKNAHFRELFLIFLRKQCQAGIIPKVSNNILDAFRVESSLPSEFAAGGCKRNANYSYERHISKSADKAWEELTSFAQAISFDDSI